MEAVGGTGLD